MKQLPVMKVDSKLFISRMLVLAFSDVRKRGESPKGDVANT